MSTTNLGLAEPAVGDTVDVAAHLTTTHGLIDDLMDGDVTPATIGTASAGSNATEASRADHVHGIANDFIDSQHYAAASIDNEHLADLAVDTAEIANNAVTLAKMAGGTDGNLITYDASGDPAFVATGTSAQILTSNGAGAAPTMQDLAASGVAQADILLAAML